MHREAMLSLDFVLLVIAACSLEKATAVSLGACVQTCSPDPNNSQGFDECAEGFICKSNGCGYTCQHAPPLTMSQRGACVVACRPFPVQGGSGLLSCPDGYACRFNGCGQTCQRVTAPTTVSASGTDLDKRQRCAPVLCDMFCLNGWALDEHECEICKCKE